MNPPLGYSPRMEDNEMTRRGPRQYYTSSDLRPASTSQEVSAKDDIYGPTLKTQFPCCGGAARIRVVRHIPRQVYDRICGHCYTGWTVTRITLREGEGTARMDKLDWETSRVEIYAKFRRDLLAAHGVSAQ
jgi:hypothetical protein